MMVLLLGVAVILFSVVVGIILTPLDGGNVIGFTDSALELSPQFRTGDKIRLCLSTGLEESGYANVLIQQSPKHGPP